ncbi:hypothetical protein M405DRAFT_826797 [Rhizopogon salebrosus TDB-379]|nr:hypothetical protein M405DRAFT_826797 [Rhizopogon salebrosus TDB-379]
MYRQTSSLPSSVPPHPQPLSPSGHQGACHTTAAVLHPQAVPCGYERAHLYKNLRLS